VGQVTIEKKVSSLTEIPGQFSDLFSELTKGLSPEARAMLNQLSALRPKAGKTRGFADLGNEIVSALTAAASMDEASTISRALIAGLAADVQRRTTPFQLTPFVTAANSKWEKILLRYLADEAGPDYLFPSGEFVKDLRYVHGMSVYFGCQVVDLQEGIGPKTALKLAAQSPLLAAQTFVSSSLRFHVDSRWLDNFNPESWEEFYFHVADLLEANPACAGMLSTSWFFDPALAKVSPRLAYLINLPLSGGAKIVRHHTTPFDIESATMASSTRRKMYESGEYLPVSYSFIWRRADLIAWARQRRASSTSA
jgi:hypothetical protein